MYINTRALWSGVLPLTMLALAYSTNDASCFRSCRRIAHLGKAALSTVSVRFSYPPHPMKWEWLSRRKHKMRMNKEETLRNVCLVTVWSPAMGVQSTQSTHLFTELTVFTYRYNHVLWMKFLLLFPFSFLWRQLTALVETKCSSSRGNVAKWQKFGF